MPGDTPVNAYFGGCARPHHLPLTCSRSAIQVQTLGLEERQGELRPEFRTSVYPVWTKPSCLHDMALKADSFYFCDSRIDVKIKGSKDEGENGLKNREQLNGRFVMDSFEGSCRISISVLRNLICRLL